MSESSSIAVRAISFDATGTLIHAPRLGEIYAEVLRRHGLASAEPQTVLCAFQLTWQELDCRVPAGADRYRLHPGGARGFWRELLERLGAHLGTAEVSPFAAAELYDRFAGAEPWSVYPEVPATLRELRSRGFRIGVASNWDDRLDGVLAALGLGESIDVVVTSHELGRAKPAARVYHAVADSLGVEPGHLLHVGDHPIEDREGAVAAGCQALLLDRTSDGADLETLEGLATRLDLACPVALTNSPDSGSGNGASP